MTKNSSTQFASNSENRESFKEQGSKKTIVENEFSNQENETMAIDNEHSEASDTQIESLQRKYIQELEAKLAALQNNTKNVSEEAIVAQTPKKPETEYEYVQETKLSQDDYIKVMSLCSDGWHVNLSTQGNGQGRVYKFTKFGEVKNIRYGDVNDIIEAHRNLLEAGRFYIMNKDVIRHHGLDEYYSKVINKEKIEEILSGSENSIELYQSCNDRQKEMIISMLTEKVRDNPNSVDLNMVEKIAKISQVKILERAEDSKALKENLQPEN